MLAVERHLQVAILSFIFCSQQDVQFLKMSPASFTPVKKHVCKRARADSDQVHVQHGFLLLASGHEQISRKDKEWGKQTRYHRCVLFPVHNYHFRSVVIQAWFLFSSVLQDLCCLPLRPYELLASALHFGKKSHWSSIQCMKKCLFLF